MPEGTGETLCETRENVRGNWGKTCRKKKKEHFFEQFFFKIIWTTDILMYSAIYTNCKV